MRLFWTIILATAGMAGLVPGAKQTADFTGTWMLEPDRTQIEETSPDIRELDVDMGGSKPKASGESDLVPVPHTVLLDLPQTLTLHIVQTDTELHTTREFANYGEKRILVQKFKLDGSQCLNLASDGNGEFVSRSNWKNGTLLHSGSQTSAQGIPRTEFYVQESYSLSRNRKTLTIKTMRTSPRGVVTLKHVFSRLDK